MDEHILLVDVVEAKQLGASVNAVVSLAVGGVSHKTKVWNQSSNPAFHELFEIPLNDRSQDLVVQVQDKSNVLGLRTLGTITIPLAELGIDQENAQWHTLPEGNGSVRLEVQIATPKRHTEALQKHIAVQREDLAALRSQVSGHPG